jgi:DNA-binding transcriptional regulator LsrR (DeoR family)
VTTIDTSNYSQDDLIVLATWMYYEDGMTHQEVADQLGMSRVAVTRLLQKARQQGVVKFRITKPRPPQFELSQALVKRFGLKKAIVIKNGGTLEETLEAVGEAGARHLREVITPGCRLGVGWSSTLQRMAAYLEPLEEPIDFTINEMVGSMLKQSSLYRISSKIFEIMGGRLVSLPVPVVVQSAEAFATFLQEPIIATGLEGARQCDVAFVGVGDVAPDGTMVQTGYLKPDDVRDLSRRGAVGDVLLRYFTIDGEHVPTPNESVTMSPSFEEIRCLPYLVGVVAGPEKVEAIIGALRGGILDCLITDSDTAGAVLARG